MFGVVIYPVSSARGLWLIYDDADFDLKVYLQFIFVALLLFIYYYYYFLVSG